MAYTSLSGSKLRSKMGATLNESASTTSPALLSSQSSFAKRHLEAMGWSEGTGLGKRRNGMVDHIKIKQRQEEMGLGQEKEACKAVGDVWWKDSVGGTLARLQKKSSSKKKSKKDKSKKEADKIFTDEELFQATGGARFGMRAQRRAEGKWKRTESGLELQELEEKARSSMEWNGRGDARVVIVAEDKRKSKKRKYVDDNDGKINEQTSEMIESEKKRLKKLRRESKKKMTHEVSPLPSEEEAEIEKRRLKKLRKEEKKKSKK